MSNRLGQHKVQGRASGRVSTPQIRDLLRIPERYLRSVHLERDFHDLRALQQYVVTPPMIAAATRIAEGLCPGSGRRAWRVTGDYGSGKSSFALVLAQLLRDPSNPTLARARKAIDFRGLGLKTPRVIPVLLTGVREPVVPTIARAVMHAVDQLRGRGRAPRALAALARRAAEAAAGDEGALCEVLIGMSAYATGAGYSGVLLIVDELGKLLEYAAMHPDREDVYALQRLAEVATRSGDHPLVVMGLLHQGFHAYAERLPSAARREWEKVAGRFEEVVFDQPLAHTGALVAGALNLRSDRLPPGISRSGIAIAQAVARTGWYGSGARESSKLDPLSIYPLHPMVLPVLIRFFARFGQHERSLFSFLLSSEPFALQSFAEKQASADAWYRLSDFYDYVRAVFGHQLAGASYRSQWLRIVGVLEGAVGLDATELRVLKSVGVLNALDAEHLVATDTVLAAAVADRDSSGAVKRALARLRKRGILYARGAAGGYCLWPTTSINLETALESARRALGSLESVASHVAPYLDATPLLARRHYIATGTLRHFEVRYANVATLPDTVARPSEADGVVVVALCDNAPDRLAAEGFTTTSQAVERPDVLIAVPPPLVGLSREVQDARCWQWVADNTPELTHDTYAAAEVARQVAASGRALMSGLSALMGFRAGQQAAEVTWTRAGQPVEIQPGRGLLATLSDVCDELYSAAPRIRNELLNRRTLSSAAAAARLRLIERMFTSASRANLGIDPNKAPPEKSMYLSVLAEGAVHRVEDGHYVIAEPPDQQDPLRLRPVLRRVMGLLEEAGGQRVPVPTIIAALRSRPYGIRPGVIPLLLAIVAVSSAHELAVYENGTFLQRLGPSDFLRLIKLPTAFEFQLCRVTGVRADVFERLVEVFASERPAGRRAELLDVVTPLCIFAAQLPESTRKSSDLPATAAAVRDALLSAREPVTLLFNELAVACDVGPFAPDEPVDRRRVRAFVGTLRGAMDDLRAAYPRLLDRLSKRVASALGAQSAPGTQLDRTHVASRAGRVALAAREPRLRAFALRLADVALAEDAWAEALGSFVIAKPPARWAPGDEARAGDEIDVLAARFRHAEAVVFKVGDASPTTGVRINLVRGDGAEAVRVVYTRPEDEASVEEAMTRIAASLPMSEELRIIALSQLLWNQLEASASAGASDRGSPSGNEKEEALSKVIPDVHVQNPQVTRSANHV